jgi:hypothetical protein
VKDKFILDNVELLEKVVATKERIENGTDSLHDRVYENLLRDRLIKFSADLEADKSSNLSKVTAQS